MCPVYNLYYTLCCHLHDKRFKRDLYPVLFSFSGHRSMSCWPFRSDWCRLAKCIIYFEIWHGSNLNYRGDIRIYRISLAILNLVKSTKTYSKFSLLNKWAQHRTQWWSSAARYYDICRHKVDCVFGSGSWWSHQMETFSALLALCVGNSPVTGEFPSQSPVTRSFDFFTSIMTSL